MDTAIGRSRFKPFKVARSCSTLLFQLVHGDPNPLLGCRFIIPNQGPYPNKKKKSEIRTCKDGGCTGTLTHTIAIANQSILPKTNSITRTQYLYI